MIDYCLKNTDEEQFNRMMLDCGLCIETEDGIIPSSYEVLIDRIGSITIIDYSTDPVTKKYYPEYYTNVRLLTDPTVNQAQELSKFQIEPSQPQYKEWA